jgi:hypothetical protein
MLKIRYFSIRLPIKLGDLASSLTLRQVDLFTKGLRIVQSSSTDIIFAYTVERMVSIRRFLADGEEVVETAATMDRYSIRLFQMGEKTYLSLVDPGRSSKIIIDMLDSIFQDGGYFLDVLEIQSALVEKHTSLFDSAKLVSAKIRDFEVYDGAVGRLEISSQNGLLPEIAPFLEEKFYRVDSLTYEITHKFTQGLVQYARSGTVKISGPLISIAFPFFESCLV